MCVYFFLNLSLASATVTIIALYILFYLFMVTYARFNECIYVDVHDGEPYWKARVVAE